MQGKKLTTKDFITKAKSIYCNKYDYSKTNYTRWKSKIIIFCIEHQCEFIKIAHNHLNGSGCPICAKIKFNKKYGKTTKQFIKEAKKVHGNKYDYSKTKYTLCDNNVIIICKKHGEFSQRATRHLSGGGCKKCQYDNLPQNNPCTSQRLIEKFIEVHSNTYDYSKVVSGSQKTSVKIICKKHGEFKQKICYHIKGSGCPICTEDKSRLSHYEFLKRAVPIHGNKYTYLTEYKNSITKMKMKCNVCNKIFYQIPGNHLNLSHGCPYCKQSKGELKIEKYLEQNNIKFEIQKRFKKCKNKRPLPFDFYLPTYNICIEYDGRQHYQIIEYFDGKNGFNKRKHNDNIKTKYCLKNNIDLLRIPYTEFKNIENVLQNRLLKV